MIKKLINLSIILFFFCEFSKAQEPIIFDKKNIVQDERIYLNNYNGKVLKFNNHFIFRGRTYGRNYLQFTLIYRINCFDFRCYEYFSIFDSKLTPALSVRCYF